MEIEGTLKRSEVFLGLDDSDLAKIAALPSCRALDYQTGEMIFQAGKKAEYLYIIKEGQVDLVMEASSSSKQPTKVVIDRATTGGTFGWSALVKPHFYTGSAICAQSSKVVAVSGVELTALFEQDNHLGYQIYQRLCQVIGARLRNIEQVLIKGKRWPFIEQTKSY